MRIKVTEEQYALLNEYINSAKNISEEEEIVDTDEALAADDPILNNVSVDLEISDTIQKLVNNFPDQFKTASGVNGLGQKLKFLSSPAKYSGKELTSIVNALYVLSYLKKMRDQNKFEPATSGFFFESFIAGLLGVQRADLSGEKKGAADIVASDGSTWSLKLYSDGEHQIQVKSGKEQKRSDITDGIILGVKTNDGVDVYFYDTSYIKNPNFDVFGEPGKKAFKKDKNKRQNQGVFRTTKGGKYTDKWVINQSYIKNNPTSKYTLNYSNVKSDLQNAESSLMCVIDAMERQMKELKNNIDDMITGEGSITAKATNAKNNATNLDGLGSGSISCDVKSDKKGLIDKSVDVLTKSAEVQSN